MADNVIPDDVRDFILRNIDSIAQLEALLLLHANKGETWDVARTASRLYATEEEITEVLTHLCAAELLSNKDGLYRFDCDPAMQGLVDRLAEVYRRQLIPVTNTIHAKPRRIREFANAFKIRRNS
jgi:hypothetical protein